MIKLVIFMEVLVVMVCGAVRIFMPFPFIKVCLTAMTIMAGCVLFAYAVTPVLKRWLGL